ncbi:lysostaphin resistance A-like protein [Carboxylicivirga caseinilyticus]|uniref:CPBP family intramembrane glutamic endopeptidase n=1 Tax=Carboxylicivirga caseinilyticus TaxID=3417572 RepID=UPI003D325D1C|nr:CPBP family intramembrane metalloprotease [Marinilabiliaceae bacterium A049]
MTKGTLNHFPPILKLLTLIIIVLTGSLILSLISLLIAKPVFGVDINSADDIYNNIQFLQVLQILQSLFVFILPSTLAVHLLYLKNNEVIPGKGKFNLAFFLIAFITILLSQSFISWTAWINQQLQLPEFLSSVTNWISLKEEQAANLTDLMLTTSDWKQTLVTVFLIAVLPAIGEEWLFRGLIQRELMNLFKNAHIAVIITAIIFSAIHIQFLTFLPRFVLGLILGYMMIYSRNIWMPITAHFTNNFMAVIIYQFYQRNEPNFPNNETYYSFDASVIISLVIIIGSILATYQLGKKQVNS